MTPDSRRTRAAPTGTASEERAARQLRALEERLSVRLRSYDGYPLLEVGNPVHRTSYLVMFPEYPGPGAALCTCTDFARRGLVECKHIAAGLSWLSRHPPDRVELEPAAEARLDGLWGEVDRRLGEQGPRDGPPPRELARPGAALFEGPVRPRSSRPRSGSSSTSPARP